jgi:GntR family transcriptional regulator, transcriptional repressor for pyruvate dehydrogenase complex
MTETDRSGLLGPIANYPRDALPVEVTRRILAYLLEGRVAPGELIPSERQLATALGVGRSIVREALKSLTLLGIIEVRPGIGTFLKRMDSVVLPQSIEWGLMLGQPGIADIVEARRYLEVILAELAAARRSDADVDALRAFIEEMNASADDPSRYVQADIAFHLRVAQASGNASLAGVMTSIRSLLQVWIARVTDDGGENLDSRREHEDILDAIQSGDQSGARIAMQAHMDAAYDRLVDTLPFAIERASRV